MQTFLPAIIFRDSAKILDYRRLGKQRSECKQILIALDKKSRGEPGGWQNHPATLMWQGYESLLCVYAMEICQEWLDRGYKDTLWPFFNAKFNTYKHSINVPAWWEWEPMYSSHRARLLDKNPVYYGKFGWTEQPVGPKGYLWPIDKFGKLHPLLKSHLSGKT